jgi:hypothetical protein
MSGRGWVWNVDETPEQVKALLGDGEPHVLVPHTVYRDGHEVEPEPIVLNILDVTMLADNSV